MLQLLMWTFWRRSYWLTVCCSFNPPLCVCSCCGSCDSGAFQVGKPQMGKVWMDRVSFWVSVVIFFISYISLDLWLQLTRSALPPSAFWWAPLQWVQEPVKKMKQGSLDDAKCWSPTGDCGTAGVLIRGGGKHSHFESSNYLKRLSCTLKRTQE